MFYYYVFLSGGARPLETGHELLASDLSTITNTLNLALDLGGRREGGREEGREGQ